METIENLKAQGEALGYEGDALRAFIKDQQDRLRDERKAQREAQARERELAEAKEARERELAETAAARELKERELAEAKEARERELAETATARELKERELAEAKAEAKAAHEREIQRMQLQQDIEQKKHIFEMERLAAEQNIKPAVQHKEDKTYLPMSLLRPQKYQHLMKVKMKWILICLGLKGMLQLKNGRKKIGLLIWAHFSKVRHLMYMH